jgi:hypothetical protein
MELEMTDGEKVLEAWKQLSDPEMAEILGVFQNKKFNESEMGRELMESQMACYESTDDNEHLNIHNIVINGMKVLRKIRKSVKDQEVRG